MKRAAFFDMDFTLLDIYTSTSHARFLIREGFVRKRDLSLVGMRMGLFRTGIISNPVPSMRRVARLCRGLDSADMKERASLWVTMELSRHLRPAARKHLEAHREEGDMLVLLTSSLSCPAEQLAVYLDIPHVISNVLEIGRDGRYSGNLVDPICFGTEKLSCLQLFTEKHDIDLQKCTFYTDSHHDLPVLAEFGNPRPVNPDRILKRKAENYGWPVSIW